MLQRRIFPNCQKCLCSFILNPKFSLSFSVGGDVGSISPFLGYPCCSIIPHTFSHHSTLTCLGFMFGRCNSEQTWGFIVVSLQPSQPTNQPHPACHPAPALPCLTLGLFWGNTILPYYTLNYPILLYPILSYPKLL